MIAASNLSMRFGRKVLFENVSVKFNAPNLYGIIGANGVGKSTFMKILSGELEQSSGQIAIDKDRSMGFLKQDHYQYDNETIMDTVYMGNEKLWALHCKREELYTKSDTGEITDEESDYLYGDLEVEFGDAGGYTMEADASKVLSGLMVTEKMQTEMMSTLSGAFKFRILLAQILFAKPDIMLLDEPTNYLDMETINSLVNILKRHEGVVLVISHDRYFLNSLCTHIADLDYQEMRMFTGNYDDFMNASAFALEKQQRDNDKKEKRAGELKDFISRFGANASKAKQATARRKELDSLAIEDFKPSSRIAPYIRFRPLEKLGAKIFDASEISKSYDEKLFSDLSFHIAKDEKVAIIGPNAAGKTTLVKTLIQEIQPDIGTVEMGSTVALSYFPQDNSNYLDKNMRAIDWLGQFAPNNTITDQDLRSHMGKMLFRKEDVEKQISVLSGGEKARLVISRMLLEGGNVLVLDEPTNHLDLEAIEALNYALTLVETPIVFVSHDREFVNSLATRVIEITPEGITDYPGTYADFEIWKSKNKKKK
ncbi:MAG: ATP-binding cassette domain-containing protein [Lentisphaeraceae bacterium]|nr:ATP-binding cassette domain-containing protein [Lentisphaeraceae bacterium]